MKLQKAFFLVIALAFVVSLGSLLSGGDNQKAQVASVSNAVGSISLTDPAQNTTLYPGETRNMTCTVGTTGPNIVVRRMQWSWFQNNGAQVGTFEIYQYGATSNEYLTAGNHSKTVTLPSITPGSNFKLQCVVFFRDLTTNTDYNSITQAVGMNFVSAPAPIPGCTDPAATNYNPNATVDNGSCTYPAADIVAPSVPTGVNISLATSSSLRVSWTASTDNVGVVKYEIYRNNGGATSVNTTTPFAIVNAPATTYTNSGLLSSRTYRYNIKAVDAAGNKSALSARVAGTTLAVAAPTSVTVVSPTTSSLTLNWSPSSSANVFDYVIYANAGGSTSVNTTTPVGTVLAGTHTFTHQNLNPGTTYKYRLRARDDASNVSSLTSQVSGTTSTATVAAPSTPSGLATTSTQNSITVSWAASTGAAGQTIGYKIFRGTSATGSFSQLNSTLQTALTYTNSSLSPNVTYYYKVQACYIAITTNCSAQSSAVSGTTAAPSDATAPTATITAPTAGQVLPAGTTSTTLSVTTNEAATCKWNTTDVAYSSMINTLAGAGSTSHNASLTGLVNGTSYTRYVRCQDTVGNTMTTSVSREFSVAAPVDTTAPAVPTLSVGAVTSTTVALSWNAVTDASSPVTYRIYRNGTYIGSPISGTSMTDLDLVAGTLYSYTISACDSAPTQNCSAQSSAVTATTTAIPTIVSSLQVVQINGTVVSTLASGQQLNVGSQANATYAPLSGAFSIKANPGTPAPASIKFDLTGPSGFTAYTQCESSSPFALYGDASGTYTSWPTSTQILGAYTLTVTPYAAATCTGAAGTPVVNQFILSNFDDLTPPTNPTSAASTYRSAGEIRLSWAASTDAGGVNHYNVTRNPGTTVNVGNQTTFVDTSVTSTGTYSYTITAVDNVGNTSGVSNAVSAPTLSTSFANGNQVETNTTASIKVTPDASGNAGNQVAGTVGVITNSSAGPINPVWISGGINYWYVDFATGTDGWVNENNIDSYVPPPTDTIPPTANITAPTNNQVLSAGTTTFTMTATTNEAATCKWATTDTAYASMTNTFTGSGSTSHNYPLLGLTDGTSYTRYVRCQDTAGNPMTSSVSVTFSVASAPPSSAPIVSTPQRSFNPNQIAVVCNSQYSQSCQLADYYIQQRGIPAQNKVTLSFNAPMDNNGRIMLRSTFETGFGGTNMRAHVLNQITSAYTSAGLGSPDIQGAMLVWRYPFMVGNATTNCNTGSGTEPCVSLVVAFAKGQYVDGDALLSSGSMPTNAYFENSSGFLTPRQTHNLIPAFLLPFASGNYNEGKQFVDQGVQADNTHPTSKIYSISTFDTNRAPIRHSNILTLAGLFNQNNLATEHTTVSNYAAGGSPGNCTSTQSYIGGSQYEPSFLKNKTDVLGYHTALACPPYISTLNFLKGALVDYATSNSGFLSQDGVSGGTGAQLSITEMLKAGATASSGTQKEPWDSSSGVARKSSKTTQLWREYYTGASALQSYWSSVEKNGNTNFVGEPLANPWKDPQITFSNNILAINITHIKPGETWKLQSSTNGTSWTDVSGQTSITAPNGKLGIKTITLSNATAPYYRLVNTNNSSLPQIQRAVNGSGGGTPLIDNENPVWTAGTPNLATASPTTTSLTVSWNTATDATTPITYKLQRRTLPSGTFAEVYSGGATSFSNTGLVAGTSYEYQVRACDGVTAPNCTSWSSATTGTTSSDPTPPPPTGGQTMNGINGAVGPSLTTNPTSCTNPSGGTIFYVDAVSGNDSNNGTSVSTPWKTISKVNSSMSSINAGTMICFKREQSHRGRLAITKSGTASSKIIVDAYGAGSAPVISGNVLVTNWTQHSGNIWKATVSSAPASTPKYLFINSAYQTQARQPNTGWYFTNSRGANLITDSDNSWLSAQGSNSLTNGEVVTRGSPWSISIGKITGNSGSRIDLQRYDHTTPGTAMKYGSQWTNLAWGYILRNKLSLLDTAGEWYFDSATNTVYLWAPGNANPNTLTVEMTSESDGVYIASAGHIIVRNLIVEGQTGYAVWLRSQSGTNLKGITVENLEIRNAYHGVYHSGIDGVAESDKNTLRNNYLHDLNVTGISVQGGNGHLIEGNVIERVSTVEDRMYSSEMTHSGIIHIGGGSNIVSRRNIVRDTGYAGIWAAGSGTITENLVERAMKTLTDGAGITFDNTNGLTISKNIVKDIGVGSGQNAGTGGSPNMASQPILYVGYVARDKAYYFGDGTVGPIINLDLDSNIAINATDGIWVDHNTLFRDNKIRNNIIYDFNRSGIAFADWSNYRTVSGGCPTPDSNSPCFWPQYNDVVTGNKIYGIASYQNPLYFLHSYSNGTGAVADFGTINSNYYSNPYRTTKVQQMKNFSGQTNNWTLGQWKTSSNEDVNSTDGTYTATQAPQIFYNATISPTSQVITNACRVNGQSTSGTQTYTIQPFTAIVVEYGNC